MNMIIPPKPIAPAGNPELIALLERMLGEAKHGRLTGVGIVAVATIGNQISIAIDTRGDYMPLAVGAAQMHRQLQDQLFPTGPTLMPAQLFGTRRLSS